MPKGLKGFQKGHKPLSFLKGKLSPLKGRKWDHPNPSKGIKKDCPSPLKGKTYKEIYGPDRIDPRKGKVSSLKGKTYEEQGRSNPLKGRPNLALKGRPTGKKGMPGKKGRVAWNKKLRIVTKCKNCLKEFEIPFDSDSVFCGKLCYHLFTRNKKWSEEVRQWVESLEDEGYDIVWGEDLRGWARSQDQYRCQLCFKHQDELFYKNGKKRNLSVHHIDYNKKNCDPSNLISLCASCHAQTNFKRKDWTKYFTKIKDKKNG